MGLPYGEEIMIVGRTMWTQSTSVTDRQTDGRTELLSQRPCNAERRTVMSTPHIPHGHKMLFTVLKTKLNQLKQDHLEKSMSVLTNQKLRSSGSGSVIRSGSRSGIHQHKPSITVACGLTGIDSSQFRVRCVLYMHYAYAYLEIMTHSRKSNSINQCIFT